MKKCMIYLDRENIQNSLDLQAVNDLMFGQGNCETYAVCINEFDSSLMGVVDHVIVVENENVVSYDLVNITNCLSELHQKYDFDAILIPATQTGRMLAPRLSMRLHVGLVADVTSVEYHQGELQMVRPAFSGKIMAGITNQGKKPIMMSVRQNVFNYTSDLKKSTKILTFTSNRVVLNTVQLVQTKEKTKSLDIRDSEILISGGGGIQEKFHSLNLLADELGAQVSASRRIVDNGIASRKIQVGQSGKTVSPKLYMALGISGSVQHIEGLNNVESIISVNTDKDAPICSLSDIVVEGDAVEFIERLVKKIKENR